MSDRASLAQKVVIWNESAAYASCIQPGSLVFLEGEMSYRDYEREIETPRRAA